MENIQQQGNGKSEDFLIVRRTNEGYLVYAASDPTHLYAVRTANDSGTCTCADSPTDRRCGHLQAVLDQVPEAERIEHEERLAIQDNGKQTRPRRAQAKGSAPATMTLKRSLSPDGRIDSLSIEFCCGVDHIQNGEITAKATDMLRLQSQIAAVFLPNGGKADRTNGQQTNGSIPARMLHIGTFNGRYGPRLFIAFKAENKHLRLFGTPRELADALSRAGHPFREDDIAEGLFLNLPCNVITKPSRDRRYTDIEQVLPSRDIPPNSRGAS